MSADWRAREGPNYRPVNQIERQWCISRSPSLLLRAAYVPNCGLDSSITATSAIAGSFNTAVLITAVLITHAFITGAVNSERSK